MARNLNNKETESEINIDIVNPEDVIKELTPEPKEEKEFDVSAYRKEMMRLVRVRVTSNDPSDQDLPGTIIQFSNKYLGNVSKYIPLNGVPWHIPYVLYKVLKSPVSTYYTRATDIKNRFVGTDSVVRRPRYNVELLPPLTKEELEDLKEQQLASGRVMD